jgi:hypothetical protein
LRGDERGFFGTEAVVEGFTVGLEAARIVGAAAVALLRGFDGRGEGEFGKGM